MVRASQDSCFYASALIAARLATGKEFRADVSSMTGFTSRLDDPEYWRQRAGEMRRIADQMKHLPRARASLLETAREYDRRAARAEKHFRRK